LRRARCAMGFECQFEIGLSDGRLEVFSQTRPGLAFCFDGFGVVKNGKYSRARCSAPESNDPLPATASSLPLIGLAGLGLLGMGLLIRRVRTN